MEQPEKISGVEYIQIFLTGCANYWNSENIKNGPTVLERINNLFSIYGYYTQKFP